MAESSAIVVDANILIRAVFGERVFELLLKYAKAVRFFAPQHAFVETEKHIPRILARRKVPVARIGFRGRTGSAIGDRVRPFVEVIPDQAFFAFKEAALARLRRRDPDDWPILAAALALQCPIWTEDADFFGVGVATWTTENVGIYLDGFSADE